MMNRWTLSAAGLLCMLLTTKASVSADDVSAGKQPLNRNVKLVNVATGKVLAVEDDGSDAGARAVLSKDNDGVARQWKIEADGDYLKLTNRKSMLALDVSGESTDDGGIIIVYDDKADGNDNQRWTFEPSKKAKPGAEAGKPAADALFSEAGGKLKSKSSGLVLNVDSDGGIIQSTPDDGAKSQLWRIVEAPAYFKIVNVASGKTLGVADDSVDDEAQATLTGGAPGKEKDAAARQWRVEKTGGALRLVNRKSGKALDVSGFSSDEDAAIIQYQLKTSDEGNTNQLWIWAGDRKDANSGRRLTSASSNLVLDVDADGNAVQRRSSETAKSQLWKLVEVNE